MEATPLHSARVEFLADVAHEIRNPLAAIQAAVLVLDSNEPTALRRKRAREVIDHQVLRIARISDDLLDVGYLASGRHRLRREPINLGDLVKSAVEACRPQLDAAHLTVVSPVPPQPVIVEIDPLRMTQVLTNLLDNAAKFSEPDGFIEIGIEDGPDVVSLRIVDHGIGIPAEAIPQIFDPFVQAASARARSRSGIGIGLNVVKRIVELHGGTVQAFSAGPDLGSTFTLRLPRQT